jgi:hypothetical protein
VNVVAFAVTVLINGLAGSTTLIGGQNTAQVSDRYPTLITPAGYVFAIWGVIYTLLGLFVVYQALPGERGKAYHDRIGGFFALSGLVNAVWLFLWQYELLGASVVLMGLLLVSLITIYVRLDVGNARVPLREWLAVHVPFSVYLGWITIATIANVASTLVSVSWNGFGVAPDTWATLITIVALTIALLVLATRRDVAYGSVIIWALVGIAAKQGGTISLLANISAGIVAVVSVAAILLVRREVQ